MSTVFSRISTYDYDDLKPKIHGMLESLEPGTIARGTHVLIKPNLLAPASADRALLTHPMVVKAAVEYCLDRGATITISDSPAMGSVRRVVKESGIKAALHGMDVEFRDFRSSMTVDVGEPFHRIEIAEDALKADVLINLPKLKTHAQMLLTLGVKNLFGCVVGFRKPQWHLRAGVDREMFGMLLYRIHRTVRPTFTILDGILAMEGQGPGKGGTPRHVGVVMGSEDAVALDATVCRMLGIPPESLFTNLAAKKAGEMPDAIEVEGEMPSVPDFRLPSMSSLVGGPKALQKHLRRHLIQRPVSDDALCKTCGDCWRYCPAGAIGHDGKKLDFDYEKCIRCYCCIEVCPHGALKAREPRLGKLFNRFIKLAS